MSFKSEQVRQLIANHLSKAAEDVRDETTLEDLEFDSLDSVEIVLALENTFGIEVPDEEVVAWTNVGDVVASVESRLEEKRNATVQGPEQGDDQQEHQGDAPRGPSSEASGGSSAA